MDNHDKKIPNWARRFDEAGPRRWMKEKHTNRRKGEYISAIVWNLIWLFIANKLPSWDTGFLNDHYLTVLQPLNWNIWIQIGGNILLLLIDFRFLRFLLKAVMAAATFLILMVFFYLYPFNFSNTGSFSWIDALLPILFVIGMVVSALTVISNIWKLIFWGRRD